MDLKYRVGASLATALLIGVLVYTLFNPIIVWYFGAIPGLFSCPVGSGTMCEVSNMMISVAAPLFALFLAVASVFEVFLK